MHLVGTNPFPSISLYILKSFFFRPVVLYYWLLNDDFEFWCFFVLFGLGTIFFLCRPSFPPDFKQLMEFYINQCTGALLSVYTYVIFWQIHIQEMANFCIIHLADISRNILRGISLALAGSAKEIESKISKDPFWVLRTIGYPPSPSSDGQDNARSTIGW